MPGREVTADELKLILPAEERPKVDDALKRGMGVAIFEEDRIGGARMLVTYGKLGADIADLPPGRYGDGMLLAEHVSPQRKPAAMRSPLMDWEPPRQIARPRVSPPVTAYPDVLISGRTSSHPRGSNSFHDLLPGRPTDTPAPQPIELEEPLSEGAQWWRDHL
jgi:hypothetical protein